MKNYIEKKDIKPLLNKASLSKEEYILVSQSSWTESQLQCYCKSYFDNVITEYQKLGIYGLFQQNDNGGLQNKIKKYREGTIAGFPDITINLWNDIKKKKITLYIEFKRIGGKLSDNQKKMQEFLLARGEEYYLINNSIFFIDLLKKVLTLLK